MINFAVKKGVSLAITAVLLASSVPVFAQSSWSNYSESTTTTTSSQNQANSSVVIPAGTNLMLRSTTATSAPQVIGDSISAQVTSPVNVNGQTVIPTGSSVRGEIVAVNNMSNSLDIEFREVSTPSGKIIPIQSSATVDRTLIAGHRPSADYSGGVQVQQGAVTSGTTVVASPGTGTVVADPANVNYLYPRVVFGRAGLTPGGKILGGTVGGAAFGALSGAIGGVLTSSIYRDDVNFNEGTGALRGAATGAIAGAALGLVTGLISAAADRDDVVVTSTSSRPASVDPVTNISTGSLQEIPVNYNTQTTTQTSATYSPAGDFTIRLNQPVTVYL